MATSAQLAGVDFDHLLGLIVSSNEIMQNASKVSNGYKSILVNLINKDLEEQFNRFGLTQRGINGEMKDGFTQIQELSAVYQQLGSTVDEVSGETVSMNDDFNQLLEDIAGKYNISVLTSSMQNFGTAIEVVDTSLNSAGSATEEYSRAMESIEGRLSAIRGQLEQLVLGGGSLNNFIILVLQATQAVLEFANSGVAEAIVQVSLLYAGIILLSNVSVIPKLITLIQGMLLNVNMATIGVTGLSAATKGFAAVLTGLGLNTVIVGLVALVAVTALVAKAYDAWNVTLEENQERLSELQEEYDSATSAVETTSKSLESVRDRIEEINALDAIDTVTQDELDNLLLEEARLEGILAIEKERLRLAQPELEAQAKKTVEDKVTNYYGDTQTSTRYSQGEKYTTTTYEETDRVQALKDASAEMEKQTSILNHLNEVEQTNGYLTEAETLAKQNAVRAYDEASDSVSQYAVDLQSEISGLDENSVTRKYAQEGIDAYTDALNQNSEATTENTDTTSDSTDTWQTATLELEDLADAYSNVKSEMSDMFSTYSDLSSMVDEYNSSNGASYENILELIEVADQYNGLLEFQDGQLAINTEAGNAYAKAKIDEAKATLTANTQKELEIILSGAVADAETDTAKQSLIAGEAILTAAQTAYEGVPYLSETTKAWMYMLDSVGGTDGITAETQAQIDALGESYFTQMQLLDDLSGSVGNYSSATKGASDANDDLKDSMDSFEDEIDAQIDALKDASDAIEDYYDDQIDHLKDLQDVEKAYWDAKIDALKEANEELEDQYELNNLLEAQASVSKSKVLSGGEWTYAQNEQDSADAQQALDKYYREQEYKDELDALEKSKADALAVYDKKIADLENYKEQAIANYEQQIADLEAYKEAELANYQEGIDNLTNYSNASTSALKTKVDNEKSLQDQSVSQWQAYQNAIASITSSTPSTPNSELNVVSNVNDAITEKLSAKVLGYASGTPSIKEDQIAFAGDKPNTELVIGAKYNKSMGIPMNLQKGTGILPAKQTKTLTGALMNMASNGSTYSPVANTNSKSVDITISHLELPNVSNGDEFVDYLMNFETQMIQSSYNRG